MIKVTKIQKTCPICGDAFLILPCEEKRNRHKYCSKECGLKGSKLSWDDTKRKRYGDRMRKWYNNPENRLNQSILQTGIRHSDETKKRLSEMHKGERNPFFGKKHDPETCKHMGEKARGDLHYRKKNPMQESTKQKLRTYRGENTSNWRGGITPLTKSIRLCSRYFKWRDAVFKRDGYRDWFSGISGGRISLVAHHIIPVNEIIRLNNIKSVDDAQNCEALWDINNGVTMLETNHIAYHQQWGS